jgi:hypothetical protein
VAHGFRELGTLWRDLIEWYSDCRAFEPFDHSRLSGVLAHRPRPIGITAPATGGAAQ